MRRNQSPWVKIGCARHHSTDEVRAKGQRRANNHHHWKKGLAIVRRDLNPDDHEAWTRGLRIVCLHKGILVASALVVVWAILFKVH
jgi:hypothetical protein